MSRMDGCREGAVVAAVGGGWGSCCCYGWRWTELILLRLAVDRGAVAAVGDGRLKKGAADRRLEKLFLMVGALVD
ncbi:hypothetical protein RIF29_21078 [Crotalaria pallida]|uniref:Uncharacterized protein n=1 Tax=Crotalaria pallida TaxID=3830 RepID=A0AAN9F6S1_CROPI